MEPTEDNTEEERPHYPSSKLLLETIKREADKEDDRAKSLETRGSILITLSAALLAFVSSYLKLPNFKEIRVNNVLEALPYALFIVMIAITMLLLVLSLVYSLRIIAIRIYRRIGLEALTNEENAQSNEDEIALSLTRIYKKHIDHNSQVNNKKMTLYTKGIYCTISAIILSIILYISSIFIG